MTLIDFNNFSSIKFGGVLSAVLVDEKKLFKKTKIVDISNAKINEIKMAFLNYCINDIKYIKQRFSKNYGNIVITSDYRKDKYWRKQVHIDYKKDRDKIKNNEFDKIAWSYFKECTNLLIEILKELDVTIVSKLETTMNNINVSVEADEIIAVLSNNIQGKHLIVSNDGDYYQLLLNPNIKIYNPIHKKLVEKSKSEIILKIEQDLFRGQSKDNIYPINYQTHLSDDFIKYLNKTFKVEVTDTIENVDLFKTSFNEYVKKYEKIHYDIQTQEINKGKRKARRNKSAYSSISLSDKAIDKILEKHETIEKYIKSEDNILLSQNYEINKKLYLLSNEYLPKEIIDIILRSFKVQEKFIDNSALMKLTYKHNLNPTLLIDF